MIVTCICGAVCETCDKCGQELEHKDTTRHVNGEHICEYCNEKEAINNESNS